MENPNWAVALLNSRRAERNHEIELDQLESQLPSQRTPWRALLFSAVLLIGVVAWLIH